MKVGEASPGQILCVKGRIPRSYTRNMGEQELAICKESGFIPGFLMPAWLNDEIGNHDSELSTLLFYLGPIWLPKPVGGLKKHHLFLYEGNIIALEGYDFRHLSLAKGV